MNIKAQKVDPGIHDLIQPEHLLPGGKLGPIELSQRYLESYRLLGHNRGALG